MKLFKSYRFWAGVGLLVALLLFRYSGLNNYITLQEFQTKHHHLQQLVDNHYIASVLIFIFLYASIVLIALPLPAFFTLTGGFLFGTLCGALYSALGATAGAVLFFLMIRHSLGISIQNRYRDELIKFNTRIKKYGTTYVIAIRFIAFIPFFIQNIAIGLTNISLFTYTWTTIVGVLPGSFVYAYAGQQLAEIESIQDVFSGSVLFAFVLLTVFGLVPIFIQQHFKED